MKILTANRLIDGEAVWLAADGSWAQFIDGAELAADKPAEGRLEAAGRAALAANLVVDLAMIDVTLIDGEIRPVRLRERIRANGPTTHPAFGKQAAQQRAAA